MKQLQSLSGNCGGLSQIGHTLMIMRNACWIQLAGIGLLAVVSACQESPTANQHCTRPDVGSPCSQADRVAKAGTTWTVDVYITRTAAESYMDGGIQCSRNVMSCNPRRCIIYGVPASWTDAMAIADCRDD